MLDSSYLLQKSSSQVTTYPRPQFRRGEWIDLNGTWQFQFDDDNVGEKEGWFDQGALGSSIEVPYVYQSKASGVNDQQRHDVVWYKRSFEWAGSDLDVYLHFEGVDYYTKVWVNGTLVGEHEGGHTPFSFLIGEALRDGENTITVRVEDTHSVEQPLGKQSWKSESFLCWYTKTTGIWQPVWLEEVSKVHLEHVQMTPQLDSSSIEIKGFVSKVEQPVYLEAEVYYQGEWINTAGAWLKKNQTDVDLRIDVQSDDADFRVHYWSPDTPNLYDVQFTLKDQTQVYDRVSGYFGMRSVEALNGKVLLNRESFYQKLILDQGYYKDSLMTASFEEMESDLKKVKEMGFNGVRRHQTIGDRRYMYLCDRLGLVMWAEMPSFYRFSDKSMARMFGETAEMVRKHYNHPSVIVYTLMNESWGVNEVYYSKDQQNFVNALYYRVKAMDASRLIVGNDGWEHTMTDLLTVHDYNADPESMQHAYRDKEVFVNGSPSLTSRKQNYAKGYHYRGEPVLVSEYGGIAYGTQAEGAWGYGERPQSPEEVIERLAQLTDVIVSTDYIQGYCYTQLTDVEQEVNGLLDHNHEYKFEPRKIKEIVQKTSSGFLFE